MLAKYIKTRAKITSRYIQDELSLSGIILISIGLLAFYSLLLLKLSTYSNGTYIGITLFTIIITSIKQNRKDLFFLKTQDINIFKILLLENIIVSSFFWAINFRYIPIYILLSIIFAYIFRKANTIKINIKTLRTPFTKGSFEWKSAFRHNIIFTSTFEILLLIIAFIYNNYAIAQFVIISQAILLSSIFFIIEPINYIKQYESPSRLIKAKIKDVLINSLIVFTPIIILHTIFFYKHSILLIIYIISSLLLITGNLFVKYVYKKEELLRQIIQQILIAVFIMSCIIPQLFCLLIFMILIAYFKAVRSLKEIYNDKDN